MKQETKDTILFVALATGLYGVINVSFYGLNLVFMGIKTIGL